MSVEDQERAKQSAIAEAAALQKKLENSNLEFGECRKKLEETQVWEIIQGNVHTYKCL